MAKSSNGNLLGWSNGGFKYGQMWDTPTPMEGSTIAGPPWVLPCHQRMLTKHDKMSLEVPPSQMMLFCFCNRPGAWLDVYTTIDHKKKTKILSQFNWISCSANRQNQPTPPVEIIYPFSKPQRGSSSTTRAPGKNMSSWNSTLRRLLLATPSWISVRRPFCPANWVDGSTVDKKRREQTRLQGKTKKQRHWQWEGNRFVIKVLSICTLNCS